jgi:hypothetical protein
VLSGQQLQSLSIPEVKLVMVVQYLFCKYDGLGLKTLVGGRGISLPLCRANKTQLYLWSLSTSFYSRKQQGALPRVCGSSIFCDGRHMTRITLLSTIGIFHASSCTPKKPHRITITEISQLDIRKINIMSLDRSFSRAVLSFKAYYILETT